MEHVLSTQMHQLIESYWQPHKADGNVICYELASVVWFLKPLSLPLPWLQAMVCGWCGFI